MWHLRDVPFQRKLTFVISFTVFIALFTARAAFFANDIISFKSEQMQNLQTISKVLGYNCTTTLSFDDAKAAEEVLRSLAFRPHMVAGGIYKNGGALFASYHRAREATTLPATPGLDRARIERDRFVIVSP